jgi:hypothetical protein
VSAEPFVAPSPLTPPSEASKQDSPFETQNSGNELLADRVTGMAEEGL